MYIFQKILCLWCIMIWLVVWLWKRYVEIPLTLIDKSLKTSKFYIHTPLYIRDLSVCRFGIHEGSWNQSPADTGVCLLSCFSHVWLFTTAWTVACQTSLSMGFSRQEYWTGWPCPPPGNLPDPGMEPTSPGIFFKTVMGIVFNWVDLKLRLRKLENYMEKNDIRAFSNTI